MFLNRDLYDIEMVEEDQKETISMNNNDLFNNNNIDIDNIPWIISKYVFENNHEHGYKLHKGDIFKLGKYILRVRELGIDDDKKHFFFENKNTQKYMKDRSLNNISQAPLNQPAENYFSALNLNQIINVQRKEDNNNNNGNSDNNNENYSNSHNNNDSNNIENGSVNNENMSNNNGNRGINQSNNIQIIKNESSSSQSNSNSNSKIIENGNNNLDNNYDPINLINKIKEDDKKQNNENKNENNNAHKDISAYYSNNPSIKNSNNCQSQHSNEIVSNQDNNSQSNSNKNNNNPNQFFINIITNNDIENNNNNNNDNLNILDDSKNKINNNSINMKSLRFNTFHNNSILNSSMNASGKNVTNFNNDNEIESSKKNMNINNNSIDNSNCQKIKSNFAALKSTASFKKKKLTNITQKKILKNSETITEKNNNPICRICLSEEYEENNPLIHPCNCDGTMKYIHLQCLRLLIQSKIKKTETESCKVFTFKTLECEICKMIFPEKIKIKGTVFYIIDLEKPDKDYIILDGLIKETPEEKSIFIVHFKDKKEIKIGRATDANIRLSDISVSRAHAVISQYNDSFYLHDTNSKFGTLISAGNKFCILYNKPFSIQKGNILFEFMMKKTLCATLRCYHPSVVFYKTYNDFLDESFIYKYQTREESMLIPEKTKSVSEYSSHVINLKPANSKYVSSKMNNLFGENNDHENENNNDSELNINKKKNSLSLQSREDMKNSNNNSPNNSYENNKKSNKNLKNDANNNSQSFFDSFKFDREKSNNNVNNVANYLSFVVNKTKEISNINQKNEVIKSNNSKMEITIENQGNENSLLVNNV